MPVMGAMGLIFSMASLGIAGIGKFYCRIPDTYGYF